MGAAIDPGITLAYYRAALAALRYVEHQKLTGRRFGPEADARWSSFRGDLTTAERIDLLIRDADAQWPASFGARAVFAKRAVAEDEPFGAEWAPLDPVDAEGLWRASQDTPRSIDAALGSVASAWSLRLTPFDPGAIAPADKLVVAGPSAIAATIRAFGGRSDLDFADQVVVVATPPGHRQLAALAGAFLNSTKPVALFRDTAPVPRATRRAILSDDTHPDDARVARELAGADGR